MTVYELSSESVEIIYEWMAGEGYVPNRSAVLAWTAAVCTDPSSVITAKRPGNDEAAPVYVSHVDGCDVFVDFTYIEPDIINEVPGAVIVRKVVTFEGV